MDIKKIILIPVLLVIALFVYSVFGNSSSDISPLYNRSTSEELTNTSQSDKLLNSLSDKLNQISQEEDLVKKIPLYDDLLLIDKDISDKSVNYIKMLEENKLAFEKAGDTKLLSSDEKKLVENLANSQLKYYEIEIPAAQDNLAFLYWGWELDKLAKEDKIVTLFHDENSLLSQEEFKNNFSEVAFLERYTKDNFKYDNQDLIQRFYPQGIDVLNLYKNYFASYYAHAKAYADGNAAAIDNLNNLVVEGFDPGEGIDSTYATSQNKFKNTQERTIPTIAATVVAAKNLEKKGYSLNEDLIACQLYAYKTLYYQSLNQGEVPQAQDIKAYIVELNTVKPATTEMDKLFDPSSMKLENTEDRVQITCKDNYSQKTLVYKTLK